MNVARSEADGERPLDILGIGEAEERVYRWLLIHPGAIAPELSAALALTPRKTQRLLDAIEAKGLVTHSPERPRRYHPSAPDIAMEALALKRQEMLKRARETIHELQQQTSAQQRDKLEPMVELITNRQAERKIFEHLHHTAQREVVTLLHPPLRVSRLDLAPEEDARIQREAQKRGVIFRTIADHNYLALSGAMERVRDDLKSGEEMRVSSQVPFKMVMADQDIALIPLSIKQEDGPSLLVRSSALIDALYSLFEMLWPRAAPMGFAHGDETETDDTTLRLRQDMEDLVTLMAAGLNDKRIASELDISVRTLRRRTAELMKALDARTRFQAGWLAALRLSDPCAQPRTKT